MGELMARKTQTSDLLQSQMADEFLYFFLRVRKDRVRKVVTRIRDAYPEESPEQLARRLIESKAMLSVLGGTLTHLPMLVPGLGTAIKFLGFVGGTSVMARMHLYLILEIALLFGKDIDSRERIPEMIAVVAGIGLGASAPFLVSLLELNPWYALPAAAVSSTAVTRVIGESALRLYGNEENALLDEAIADMAVGA